MVSVQHKSSINITRMGSALESLRLVAVRVKYTATPSMVAWDQDTLRDPGPFSMTNRLNGMSGGPA